MIELPFIPGFLISLLIIILIIRAYTNLANRIGEGIRMFFIKIWKIINN